MCSKSRNLNLHISLMNINSISDQRWWKWWNISKACVQLWQTNEAQCKIYGKKSVCMQGYKRKSDGKGEIVDGGRHWRSVLSRRAISLTHFHCHLIIWIIHRALFLFLLLFSFQWCSSSLNHVSFSAWDAPCYMSGVFVCISAVRTVADTGTDIMFYKFGMASIHTCTHQSVTK